MTRYGVTMALKPVAETAESRPLLIASVLNGVGKLQAELRLHGVTVAAIERLDCIRQRLGRVRNQRPNCGCPHGHPYSDCAVGPCAGRVSGRQPRSRSVSRRAAVVDSISSRC